MQNLQTKFITFEGTEGVGKSTAIQNLANYLRQNNIDFIQTREPGGSDFAEELRKIITNPNKNMADDSELLLMFCARADHVEKVILPALNSGKWVLCDRFTDSTWAYQGFGRGYGEPKILQKIQLLSDNFVTRLPDVTFWLDLPVVEGMKRAKKRGELDRFEQEDVAFFERIYQGFAQLQQQNPQRIKRINADGSPDVVLQRLLADLGVGLPNNTILQ